MERVRSFRRSRLLRRTAGSELCLVGWRADQRKVFDRTGPGDFRIIEGMISLRPGNLWQWHDDERNVPERGGNHGTTWNPAFNPCVPEETCREQPLWRTRAAEKLDKIAGQPLMELPPVNIKLRLGGSVEIDGGRGRYRWGQLQEIEWVVRFVRGHILPIVKRRTRESDRFYRRSQAGHARQKVGR